MITTEWRLDPALAYDPYFKEYPRRPKRVRAEYGFDEYGFDITGRVQEKTHGRWREIASGALGEIEVFFPELAPYLKWDVFRPREKHPYEGLEEIWNDVREGTRSIGEFEYRTRFGALPDDMMPPMDTPWDTVHAWLKARHPRLMEAFHRDMRTLARTSGPGFREGRPFEGPKAWFPEMGR